MKKKSYIIKETYQLFSDYDTRMDQFNSKASQFSQLKHQQRTFSYEQRYKLKSQDPEKKRFCENVTLSKKYENTLKDFAHLIIKDVELLFEENPKKELLKEGYI